MFIIPCDNTTDVSPWIQSGREKFPLCGISRPSKPVDKLNIAKKRTLGVFYKFSFLFSVGDKILEENIVRIYYQPEPTSQAIEVFKVSYYRNISDCRLETFNGDRCWQEDLDFVMAHKDFIIGDLKAEAEETKQRQSQENESERKEASLIARASKLRITINGGLP